MAEFEDTAPTSTRLGYASATATQEDRAFAILSFMKERAVQTKEQVQEIKREAEQSQAAVRRITRTSIASTKQKGIWKPEKLKLSKAVAQLLNLSSDEVM